MLTEISGDQPDEILTSPKGNPVTTSEWVVRWLDARPPGRVLDFACGSGRHACWAASRGHEVLAVDRDPVALESLGRSAVPGLSLHCEDLEKGPWSLTGQAFDVILCTNYLFRPRMALMLALLAPGGLWIHETFAVGNEAYGRPRNPDFLLCEGELLSWASLAGLQVIGYESGLREQPSPAVIQRIAAIRSHQAAPLPAVMTQGLVNRGLR